MRTAPSLDRIIVGSLLVLIVGAVAVSRLLPFGNVDGQVTPVCGNHVSGETYGACTVTADCSVGACVNGVCTELCDGGTCCDQTCRFKNPSTVCRNKVGVCDSIERCTGISPDCPEDSILSEGTICRASAGVCDSAERCDGQTVLCPADTLVYNAICRQATGECDKDERCNGATVYCPPDSYQPAGVSCGKSNGCSASSCNGSNGCVSQSFPDGTTCDLGSGVTGACSQALCKAVVVSSSSSSLSSVTSSSMSSLSSAIRSSLSSLSSVSSARPPASSAVSVTSVAPLALCGDGVLQVVEQCDDGNVDDGDGCDRTCHFENVYCCKIGLRLQVPVSYRLAHREVVPGALCRILSSDYEETGTVSTDPATACLCGNGSLDPGESCDGSLIAPLPDGSVPSCPSVQKWSVGDLGCTSACTLDASACIFTYCGDGVLGVGEECDDKGRNTLTCDADCSTVSCGDGFVNEAAGEECDDAWENIDGVAGACRTDCTLARCGDGVLDGSEECDDGNTANGDGCNQACRREPVYCCQEGVRTRVDDAVRDADPVDSLVGGDCNALSPDYDVNSIVSRSQEELCACGDGQLELDEWCDGDLFSTNVDGRSLKDCSNVPWLGPDYDGSVSCTSDCTIDDSACRELYCGDGRLNTGEQCEGDQFAPLPNGKVPTSCNDVFDTPQRGQISCGQDCLIDATQCQPVSCGDGLVDPGEECDDAGETSACNHDCHLSVCGDGQLNLSAGEHCDAGRHNDDYQPNACRADCQPAHCGDQVIDNNEQCDDGNDNPNDGCNQCHLESIHQCNPSLCESCGNAMLCTRSMCASIGCEAVAPDGFGTVLAVFGNPLGLESYQCGVPRQCPKR